jgi:putative redox protein
MSDTARQPIVVTHDGGVRFIAQVRSHRLTVDQPLAAGGEDAGPAPIELLGTALGTCIAFYVQQFLHSRGLAYEGMRVEVEQRKASNPSRIGTFAARVVLPTALPPAHAELLERVARSCPAHGTLTHPAQVLLTIESPAEAAA